MAEINRRILREPPQQEPGRTGTCNLVIADLARAGLARLQNAGVFVGMLLFASSLYSQQGGVPATEPLQLPASGRWAQSAGSVSSQQRTSQGASASVVQPDVSVTGDYQGSIPTRTISTSPVKLSLVEAVKLALQTNLGIITADVSSSISYAQQIQARSRLLPQVSASIGGTETQINLAAYGLSQQGASTFPNVVGPFQYVQGQGNLFWNALNLTSIRNYQTEKSIDRATRLSARDARELVVLAVGGTYLQVVSAGSRIESQRAQVKYAQATYDRAVTQLSAGTNTRVDVTRSLVQLQSEQERLLAYEGDYEQQKITFARMIGLPLGSDIVLTEQLKSAEVPAIDDAQILRSAFEHRWDLRATLAQERAAEQAVAAARAERLPSLSFNGYYGAMGPRPNESHGVFVASGSVNIPVFSGGKIGADVQQAEATLRQRQSEYQDQKGKIEQDVRNALIQLRTAMGQVKLAESNQDYARETLTQVQDRFVAGVTSTVEVVQAQQQAASADNDYISSLFAFNLARLNLARATGNAEAELVNLFPSTHP